MIGDNLLLYDIRNDKFLAGWTEQKVTWDNGKRLVEPACPLWCEYAGDACIITRLSTADLYKKRIGEGVRIVSETKAQMITNRKLEVERCRT